MKTLLILRHGKSSWAHPGLDDFDRPLNNRGIRAALLMGKYLQKQGLAPDLVLCSAAKRTQETWDLVAQSFDPEPSCKILRSLYLASAMRILQTVQRTPADVGRLLVIGHNPGSQRLAADLTAPGSRGPGYEDLTEKFPTAALAVISSKVTAWSELDIGQSQLAAFIKPRDLA